MRKTKIIATIGPSSSDSETISQMIDSGVDVFRFNMKHADPSWHGSHIEKIEAISQNKGIRVGKLLDLQGPEIRIANFPEHVKEVGIGQVIQFTAPDGGGIPLDHPDVFPQLTACQLVYIDDGLVELKITEAGHDAFTATVIDGSQIVERKTVNFPGAALSFPALIEKDLENLSLATKYSVDFIALSFVRSPENITLLRSEMEKKNIHARIIAKIEHPEAVKHIDDIIRISDGIMVARGDLGIEYPLEEVPHLQKMMVEKAREEGRIVIIATQMLESMVESPRPTRAEVSDVANAVYDSADAVMLSGETASGKYPVRAVQIMDRIAVRVDSTARARPITIDWQEGGDERLVLGAAAELMNFHQAGGEELCACIVYANSASSVQLLSSLRPGVPLIAVTEKEELLDKLLLSWGILPVKLPHALHSVEIIEYLLKNKEAGQYLVRGNKVLVITASEFHDTLDTLRLLTV